MDDLPEPLISPEVDIAGFGGFMLDVDRLLASELVALATPEESWCAFMLWCRAWQQRPAGSLPNDERVLASFSRAGARWKKVRAMALHGFILCSDGRLYHPVVCAQVMKAWAKRRAYRNDQERLQKWREAKRGNGTPTPAETHNETGFNGVSETLNETASEMASESDRQGQGQGQKKERKNSPLRPPLILESPTAAASPPPDSPRLRGSRLPSDWQASGDDEAFARSLGLNPARILASFRDYWTAKSGADATKLDWSATWRNWCRREAERGGKPPDQSGGAPSAANPTGRPVSLVSGAL